MKRPGLVFWLGLLVVFLLAALVAGIPLSGNDDYMKVVTAWAGMSTVALAVFTATYVATTARQVEIMRSQLNEYRVSRTIQILPLMQVSSVTGTLKPPAYTAEPSENWTLQFVGRFDFNYELTNIGNGAATFVDCVVDLQYRDSSDKWVTTSSITRRFDFLQPREYGEAVDFAISTTQTGHILTDTLSLHDPKYPRLSIYVLYTNGIGGYFLQRYVHHLLFSAEDREQIACWQRICETAQERYALQIRDFVSQRYVSEERRLETFFELRAKLAEDVGETEIALDLPNIPEGTQLFFLTAAEYYEFFEEKIKYPRAIAWRSRYDFG